MILTTSLALVSACAEPNQHAQIHEAHTLPGLDGLQLELIQQITLTEAMRDALDHGIALRLLYRIKVCGHRRQRAVWLRHAPLKRLYELQGEGVAEVRDFARLSALEAALDRIRVPLDLPADARCEGRVRVELDLAALPTPLRFPAFFQSQQWQLRSDTYTWTVP